MADPECTCTIAAPVHYGERIKSSYGGYVTYLDFVDDGSVIDPGCFYHGDDGTMVVKIRATGSTGW